MFVVFGVSGNTGKVVAETLLAQGKKVRVVVRDAAKGAPWKSRGAEVAVAELSNAAALTKALTGAEGAYVLVPPIIASNTVLADDVRVTDAIQSAVDASGVGHVVLLSSIGAQHAAGTGPIRALHDAENKLRAGKALTTFVRAAYFLENWGGSLAALPSGALPTFIRKDVAIPMVATRDIGATAAKALLEGPRGRQVIELAGPRDYSPVDIAGELSAITGKTIAAQEGPEAAIVPTFTGYGFSADMAELFREMTHGINTGLVAFEHGAARAVRGSTTAADVLKGLLAQTR